MLTHLYTFCSVTLLLCSGILRGLLPSWSWSGWWASPLSVLLAASTKPSCQRPEASRRGPVRLVHHQSLSHSFRVAGWWCCSNSPNSHPHPAHRMTAHIRGIRRLSDASRLGSLKNKSSCVGFSHCSVVLCLSIAICFCPLLPLSSRCMSHHLWACVLH